MRKYTVVLLRPEYLCLTTDDADYGRNIYVALVLSKDEYHAVKVAQKEVFEADKRDGLDPEKLEDYLLCVLFANHQEVKLFGWQM